MGLHDFLACSLELLSLLEALERRQALIAADTEELASLSQDNSVRAERLAQLVSEHGEVNDGLNRAAELLDIFPQFTICS